MECPRCHREPAGGGTAGGAGDSNRGSGQTPIPRRFGAQARYAAVAAHTGRMSWLRGRWVSVPTRFLVCVTISGLAIACTSTSSGPNGGPSAASAVQLTGYRSVSLSGTSGAVTVTLAPVDARQILGLVLALPRGPGPDCEEPPALVYRLTVAHSAGLARGTVISGYRCGGAVSIAVPGSSPSWHTDTGCRLDQVIRRFVPARAEGTLQATIGCR
jgi:hypothetical protein